MEDNGMKFDMFEGVPEFDFNKLENGEEAELVSVTLKSDTKKKYSSAVRARSQEEYETFIESIHYETMTRVDGSTYEVRVTVLKPEVNPLENLKPVYCWGTSN
ncbi:putative HNH endonuclease [Escherichia phage A4]|nr:putative HNH endonuclease [Escherichia phage A4]